MKKNSLLYRLAASAALLLVSISTIVLTACASTQKEVPANVSEEQLILMAQEAYDGGNSKLAEYYYQTVVARFGTNNTSYVIARYEIAHLWVKEGRYNEAIPVLEDVLGFYEDEELAATLPPEYKKLASNDLARARASK